MAEELGEPGRLPEGQRPTEETAAFTRARAERIGLAFAAAVLGAVGFLPQFGGPGYEAALGAGLVLPVTAAVVTALVVARFTLTPQEAFLRGLKFGGALVAVGWLITQLHGLRVGFCDALEGNLLFVLGPGFGALLGGASGAFVGLLARRFVPRPRRRALFAAALAFCVPLSTVLVSLVRFYTSPMVFAFDPFFGYFSGPLYDTVIGPLTPLLTYRVGSVATLLFLLCLAALLETGPGRMWPRLRARPLASAGGLLALLTSLTLIARGAELGHYSTTRSIERALGGRASVGRCDIVYSSVIQPVDVARLGQECNAHLRQLERFFASSGPSRVKVFLFANDVEKGRLMGAARTYIAKPWRKEVYVQAAGYPHPVLGHELAHVLAGEFGEGPFRVSGPLGGWIPDPGRIEGVATAASPDENDALTQEEWVAAMLRLGLLPRLENLFRLGFLGENSARAYTASGAFIRYLRMTHGAEAVRRWYGGEPLERVAGAALSELEQRWQNALREVQLSDAALATARARFQRPAFFERRCPRVIDRTAAEANARFAAGDVPRAREGFREVLRLDPHDAGARLGLASCDVRENRREDALTRFEALARTPGVAPWAKLSALENRADLLLANGNTLAARALYRELASLLVDEDRLRTLDVKRLAEIDSAGSAEMELLSRSIIKLLIGDAQGPSWDAAAPLLGEHAARVPSEGLADYLIARNLVGRGRLADAARHFDRALDRPIRLPRVLEEALRLRTIVACALGDKPSAKRALDRFLTLPLRASRREGMLRFAERCGL